MVLKQLIAPAAGCTPDARKSLDCSSETFLISLPYFFFMLSNCGFKSRRALLYLRLEIIHGWKTALDKIQTTIIVNPRLLKRSLFKPSSISTKKLIMVWDQTPRPKRGCI